MEQITIQVRDKSKLASIFELLKTLDFVDIIDADKEEHQVVSEGQAEDFFSLAGLWEDRDVQQEAIRQKAWPRQSA